MVKKRFMDKIWLTSYPPSVPTEINPDQYPSLVELIKESCTQFADRPALENMGIQITYQELYKKSVHMAAYFQKKLNMKKGDRIAIMLPNIMQYPIVLLAAMQAGLVIVNVNPLYKERELVLPLSDSGAETLVVLANFISPLEKIIGETQIKHLIVTQIGDEFPYFKRVLINCYLKYIKRVIPSVRGLVSMTYLEAMAAGRQESFDTIKLEPHDLAFLQYTGGTTGVAKGAMLTHRNVIANILQSLAWINGILEQGKEIVVTALPLYHIFSLTICCFAFLRLGALSLLITDPRDIALFIRTLSKTGFSVMVGVNTLYQALMQHPKFDILDFTQMKLALAGGMAVTKPVADKWVAKTKKPIIMGYGLTEASPVVTINPLTSTSFTGSIGLPVPSTDVRIVDDQGTDVPLGQPGELCILGPQNMLGYWHQQRETENVFIDLEWLRTGDICYMDNKGYLYLIDRKKDMILVSGFNVYPNEIEEVIACHPGVKEAAVIGIQNEQSGEIAKAYIVKKDPSLTVNTIKEYCKQNLTGYKRPKIFVFVDDLPKSDVGKVLKRKLHSHK
jgi:long-chain acyl-CoA synthetase